MAKIIITLKQGEAKTIKFTVTENGAAIDLSSATLKFGVKSAKDADAYIIEKEDVDFDKSQAASGIVKVPLSATDTDQTAKKYYYGELKITFAADNIDKSADIFIEIEQAVIS